MSEGLDTTMESDQESIKPREQKRLKSRILYQYNDDGMLTGVYQQPYHEAHDAIPPYMTLELPPNPPHGKEVRFIDEAWAIIDKAPEEAPPVPITALKEAQEEALKAYYAAHFQQTLTKMGSLSREEQLLFPFMLAAAAAWLEHGEALEEKSYGRFYLRFLRDNAKSHGISVEEFVKNLTETNLNQEVIEAINGRKRIEATSDITQLNAVIEQLMEEIKT